MSMEISWRLLVMMARRNAASENWGRRDRPEGSRVDHSVELVVFVEDMLYWEWDRMAVNA